MLHLGGNAGPSQKGIIKALEAVGLQVDKERLYKLLAELQGKDLKEIIERGQGMLVTFSPGGGTDDTKDEDKKDKDDDDSVIVFVLLIVDPKKLLCFEYRLASHSFMHSFSYTIG
jgi:ribosomal protein L12E/L44/L45/RPP1/RPP2